MIIIFTMASNFFFGQDKYQTFWLDSLVHGHPHIRGKFYLRVLLYLPVPALEDV